MKELVNSITTMSSKEISDITGKEHRNVIRDITKLNQSYKELGMLKIEQGYYLHPNTGKQKHRCFNLTKAQVLDLISNYKTEHRTKITRYLEEAKPLEVKELAIYDKGIFDSTDDKITSLEIAEISGKNHFDLMRAIRKMEVSWVEVNECKFTLVEYKDKKGEVRPMYLLDKEECLYVSTKFNDTARAKLVKRWKELEEKQSKPISLDFSNPDTVLMLAQNWKKERDLRLKAEETVTIQAPKVEYHDEVLTSTSTYTTTQIAKELGLTPIALNKQLKELKIQYKQSGTWLLYKEYLDKDYTDTETFKYIGDDGETKTRMTTKWTEKGRKFIHELYNNKKLKQ